MKAASLFQALILTIADILLLWKYEISHSSLLIGLAAAIALPAVGMSFTLNSCFTKIAICSAFCGTAVMLSPLSTAVGVLFGCLVIHISALWCETERAAGSKTWKSHFKFIHRMRHNWLGSLSLYAAIGFCYVIIHDYYMFSSIFNMFMLTAVPLVTVMYAEVNRVHNQNAFWVEVSGPLSASPYYWKIMLLAAGLLFILTWGFNEAGVEKVIQVRQMFDKETDKGDNRQNKSDKKISGFQAGQITLNPKVDIELTDSPEFMIKFDDVENNRLFQRNPFYVTVQNLVDYSNSTWRPKRTEGRMISDISDGTEDSKITVRKYRGSNVGYTVYLLKPGDKYLYSLTGLHTVHLPRMVISSTGSFGIINNDPSSLKKYRLESSYYNFNDIKRTLLTSISRNTSEYVELPDSPLVRKITRLTDRIVNNSDSLAVKISKIKNYLGSQCSYSLKVDNPGNRVPLDNFLFYEKKGHCVLYASAFTLMLRSQGIPCRLVNGYAGGEYDIKNKVFLVKAKNAHAWTEIYLDRYGWIVCDPTPEATNIQPGRTSLKNFSEDKFDSLEEQMQVEDAEKEKSTFAISDNVLIILIILVVMVSFLWQYLRKIKVMTFLGKRKKVKESLRPKFISAFIDYCRKQGVKIHKSSTVAELFKELLKKSDAEDLKDMVDYYYAVTYAGDEPNGEKERQWFQYIDKKNRTLPQAQKE